MDNKDLFKQLEYLIKNLSNERLKLPYHINVIDELHINENAHSRILTRLLQYRDQQGKYEFLDSLMKYIKDTALSDEFNEISFKDPHITQEESRIDIWIRDRESGYSVIFENKINNAKDQKAQIERYINTTKDEKFDENKIFVIYLSRTGEEPESQSWGEYKESFKNRYLNLSFKSDILTWLKDKILPNVSDKDLYLRSSVMQYIDYLEGQYFLRSIDKQMNTNMEDLIKKEFGLESLEDSEAYKTIESRLKEVYDICDKMDRLKQSYRSLFFKKKIENDFKQLDVKLDQGLIVYVLINGIMVEIGEDSHKLFCQVEYDFRTERKKVDENLKNNLKGLDLNESNNYQIWKYFKIDEWVDTYDKFKDVVSKLIGTTQGL